MWSGLAGAAAKPPRLQVGIASDADAACAGSIPAGGISVEPGLDGAAAKPPRLQVGIASDA